MIVFSGFDGMSCGQIALIELGIPIEKYYASEIDKFAIKQTQHNFPDTIQLGDIEKWREWDIDWGSINLCIAGSPCQGFSFAGKQLKFSDPRSRLFFVWVEILNHIKKLNPDVLFLLENVNMKKEYLRIISEYLGLFPVNLNSNRVSAQNRDRWYWTDIRTKETGLFSELWTDIPIPEDKGILLRDILQPEEEIDEKYYLNNLEINRGVKKAEGKEWHTGNKMGQMDFPNDVNKKSKCLTTVQIPGDRCVNHIMKMDRELKPKADQNKASSLTVGGHGSGNHSDMDVIMTKNYIQWDQSGKGYNSQQDRAFFEDGKHGTVATKKMGGVLTNDYKLRRLTPIECSRLQTIPTWYKWIVSDSQIYKLLGNGWTVEMIKHIIKFAQSE